MWSYYGSKSKIAKYYPEPKHPIIIEPFSGAAWYSVIHREKAVILNDLNPVISNLWRWIVERADPLDISLNADFFKGQDISTLPLEKEHRDLIGFCANRGSAAPKKTVGQWACQSKARPEWASTLNYQLKRISNFIPHVRHFMSSCKDFRDLPDIRATWFIDPPYQKGGEHYTTPPINYKELCEWIKTRRGQVIVCENLACDWIKVDPLREMQGQRQKSVEGIYYREDQ
jgi:site-specific DNA-adenine methylase